LVNPAKSVIFILQKQLQAVEVVQVSQELQVKSTLHILGISWVIVRELQENFAISCGSGTRVDHVAVDQVVQSEQVVVTGVVNVISVLPPQSQLHQVIQDKFQLQAPAPLISCKSMLVNDTVAAVIVLWVHFVSDNIKSLFIAEFQFIVNVQVVVQFQYNVIFLVLLASQFIVQVYQDEVIDLATALLATVQV
jgi:hypothetical protein